MCCETELWRPVAGFEDAYEVSSCGRIRSLDRVATRRDGKPLRVAGRTLLTNPNGRGYLRVTLNRNGDHRWATVHSLVARAFLPRPKRRISTRREGFVVNHRDGIKANNHVSNLEYVAATANIAHARAAGLLSAKGVRNNKAKLADADVVAIRVAYSHGETQVELAARFGVDQTAISRIVRRETWAHVV